MASFYVHRFKLCSGEAPLARDRVRVEALVMQMFEAQPFDWSVLGTAQLGRYGENVVWPDGQ